MAGHRKVACHCCFKGYQVCNGSIKPEPGSYVMLYHILIRGVFLDFKNEINGIRA